MSTNDGMGLIIANAIRTASHDGIDAAIRVCQRVADYGGTAQKCVDELRELKQMLTEPAPVKETTNA